MRTLLFGIAVFMAFTNLDCGKKNAGGDTPVIPPVNNTKSDVEFWLTKPDQTALFKKQSVSLVFTTNANASASKPL